MNKLAKKNLKEKTSSIIKKKLYNSSNDIRRQYKSLSEHQKEFHETKITINSTKFNNQNFIYHKTHGYNSDFDKNNENSWLNKTNEALNYSNLMKKSLLTIKGLKKNREFLKGFGISDYHSSSTLQKSIPSISFSKTSRFFMNDFHKPNNLITSPKEIFPLLLPKPNTTKGASFGFGNRILKPPHLQKKDLTHPAPNKYNTRENLINPLRGKSFGMPFKIYSKVYFKHIKEPELDVPGPGYYNIVRDKKRNKFEKDIWSRNKSCENHEITKVSLSPNYYSPKTDIIQSKRFKSISFGVGIRKI